MTRTLAAVLLLASGCTLLSDFDSYTFNDQGDAGTDAAHVLDAGALDAAHALDAGDAAAVLDGAQLGDAGTDAAAALDAAHVLDAGECCGRGCDDCRINFTAPFRCWSFSLRRFACAASECALCGPP